MNLLTFDIEDWYHINYPATDFSRYDREEDHRSLLERLERILALCRDLGAGGTFFVLGRLLEKCPRLGERILEAGQELALHGYEHHLLRDRGPDAFQQDLERSITVFQKIAGRPPLGFRAPSWSVGRDSFWALPILDSFGFTYDSSIFPIKNFLYGNPTAPLHPFFPRLNGRSLGLLEVPVSILVWGSQRIPYSGGLYFNLLPLSTIRFFAGRRLAQGGYNLFYFHPWDLWARPRELTRRLQARWLHLRLGDPLSKFTAILRRFRPTAMAAEIERLKGQAGSAAPAGDHDR
ncbi:MAG: polysaccharide deacetylase family protein [Desulfobacterota bacterium]|jgi:polysaccharide deacetylase family protein (PEP-CTERM system associated)|nr:polysaccharide deacetylase family protein [Thermodesulfobacteriota bacterium]